MTVKTEIQKNPEDENRLLSSEEAAILSQIASNEQPHSGRAQALLAINEGTSQAEAGRKAGLTKGQLRYWLGKFRKERLLIFPEEFLNQAQPADEAPQIASVAPDLEQAGSEDETQQVVEQQEAAPKAKKKTKKAKKTKKEKKPKRVKKTKKGKKSAKKTKKKRSKKKKGAKGKFSKKSKKKGKK